MQNGDESVVEILIRGGAGVNDVDKVRVICMYYYFVCVCVCVYVCVC